MTIIRWAGFSGENRAVHPKLLPEAVCTQSLNQKPGRGDLRPWKLPSTVATVPSGRNTIYRMGRDVASDANYWLSWTSTVHAVRGFDAEDTTERTYYTGNGAPKATDNTMALAGAPYPTTYRPLGLPAPATAPTVTVDALGSGVTLSGITETRFYVYTYVNDWGWESAPSPVSAQIDRDTALTATIGSFASVPSGHSATAIRIYRTQAGSDGSADVFFMREITYGTSSTKDDNRALGEVCPTKTWLPPPDDLSNLTALWNGMLAGISGNSVRFCEAYTPYAWPIAYDALPPDSKPVALGVFGQSLLVLTTGRPLLVAGSAPDSMDQQPLELPQGCVAPRSVVSMGTGVAWASNDGLVWYGAGGARILTAGIMLREDWQALVPSSIIGQMYEGLYFGSYSTDGDATRKGFIINQGDPQGIYFLSDGFTAAHFDELQDQLYVLNGTAVQRWDAGVTMTYTAKSKAFSVPSPQSFSCAQVTADSSPVTFKLYADGTMTHTHTVTSIRPFRLPAGLADTWQMELTGTAPVQMVAIASSMAELGTT